MNELVSGAVKLQFPVRGEGDVLVIVRVVSFTKETIFAGWVEPGQDMESRSFCLYNRFFLGILNLLLELESFKAKILVAKLLIGCRFT